MKSGIPTITVAQMREVSRLCSTKYGITSEQTGENAAIHISDLAIKRFLRGKNFDKAVYTFAGKGGCGAVALACARHMIIKGIRTEIYLSSPLDDFQGDSGKQLSSLINLGADIKVGFPDHYDFDLIIDGLIGYGLEGIPSGLTADIISWCQSCGIPILSVDIPSGMDGDTGRIQPPAIRASATLTLGLPKKGLFEDEVFLQIGDLFLADIGIPPPIYEEAGLVDDKIRFLFQEYRIFQVF